MITNYVLVPGSWHAHGALDPLARKLHTRDCLSRVHTVELPYHDPRTPPPLDATLAAQSDAVIDYIIGRDLTDVVLYGHSSAGVLLTQVVPAVWPRLKRVVFHSAFIPQNGESLYDTLPEAYVELFESLTDGENNTTSLPYYLWRDGFIQDATTSVAKSTFARLVPEPVATANTSVDTGDFDTAIANGHVKTAYILDDADTSLPQGETWGYGRFVERTGHPRVIRVNSGGSHELALTQPAKLARYIITASRG